MGKVSSKSVIKWRNNNYQKAEVLLSKADHATIKQWCRQNGYTIGSYIYEVVIKDMAERGIRLEGTATRDVEAIVNNVSRETQNNVTDSHK